MKRATAKLVFLYKSTHAAQFPSFGGRKTSTTELAFTLAAAAAAASVVVVVVAPTDAARPRRYLSSVKPKRSTVN